MEFGEVIEQVGKAVDAVGVGITVLGVVAALLVYGVRLLRRFPADEAYRSARQGIGRAILLGLEFLVAGDIIRTVAVSPTFRSVGVLAVIVLIRTFLSMALEVEIGGELPWRRGQNDRRSGADG